MEKIKALINGKDVTTDWIEEIFDDCTVGGYNADIYVGFICNVPIVCKVNESYLTWEILSYYNNTDEFIATYDELISRLKKRDAEDENICSEINDITYEICDNSVIEQVFYFKERQFPPKYEKYLELKKTHPKYVILVEDNGFYEAYNDDASRIADVIGTKVRKMFDDNEDDTTMTLFKSSELNEILPKLVGAGIKVVMCEQEIDKQLTKKLVKRNENKK